MITWPNVLKQFFREGQASRLAGPCPEEQDSKFPLWWSAPGHPGSVAPNMGPHWNPDAAGADRRKDVHASIWDHQDHWGELVSLGPHIKTDSSAYWAYDDDLRIPLVPMASVPAARRVVSTVR